MRHSLVPAVLRYVDQVARCGSIQQAAKDLHVAASAIHRQIQLLEAELGVPLFERLPRGMRLTPPGDAVVTLARRWRSDEERAVSDIRRLQGVQQGRVRIAAMDSHASSFLPALVEALALSHPLITLALEIGSTDAAVADTIAGRVDLMVVFNLPPRRELATLWRAELPLGCVVAPGHALAAQDSVSLQTAASHPVVLQSRALAIRQYLEAQYHWLFANGHARVETNSLHLVKQLVRGGRYIAFTSELDAATELLEGHLRFVPVRDEGAEPQTVQIAIDARKPLSSVARVVATALAAEIERLLLAVRAARAAPEGASGAAAEQ